MDAFKTTTIGNCAGLENSSSISISSRSGAYSSGGDSSTGERGSSTNRRESAAKGNKTMSRRGRCLITNTIIRESRKGDEHGQSANKKQVEQ